MAIVKTTERAPRWKRLLRGLGLAMCALTAMVATGCNGGSDTSSDLSGAALFLSGGSGGSSGGDPGVGRGVTRIDIPSPYNFGNVPVNTTATANIPLTNTGQAALDLPAGSVSVTPLGSTPDGIFTASDVTPAVISVGNGRGSFNVNFTPTVVGQVYQARIDITPTSPDTGATLFVVGIGATGSGGGNPGEPDPIAYPITVYDSNDTIVYGADNATGFFDYGLIVTPDTGSETFTLANNTDQTITILNPGPEIIVQDPPGGYNLSGGIATTVPANGSTEFTITYDPNTSDRFVGTVSIDIQDQREVSFFLVAGMADELYVLGQNIPIPNGDTTPRLEDNTLFANLDVYSAEFEDKRFNLFNNDRLFGIRVNSMAFSTNDENAFSISVPPAATLLSPEGTAAFELRFTATAPGELNAELVINYTKINLDGSDGTTGTYSYMVRGFGEAAAALVQGQVEQYNDFTEQWEISGSATIIDDTLGEDLPTLPATAAWMTDWNVHPLGVPKVNEFLITNIGNVALQLPNFPAVGFIGPDSDQWRVVRQPESTIPADLDESTGEENLNSSEFTMEFRSAFTSTRLDTGNDLTDLPEPGDPLGQEMNAIARIYTSSFEDKHRPHNFNIQGNRYRTALTVQADPVRDPNNVLGRADNDVTEYRNARDDYSRDNGVLGITIPHGAELPREGNLTDFGGQFLSARRTHYFLVRNDANHVVDLTGTPVINVSGEAAENYTVNIAEYHDWDGTTHTVSTWTDWLAANGLTIGDDNIPMGPNDFITFDITFRTVTIGRLAASVNIRNTDSINHPNTPFVPTTSSTPAAIVPNYTFNIFGRGDGPKIQVDFNGTVIERSDASPNTADGTRLPTAVYIADGGVPSGDGNTFTITNIGNITLELGEGTGPGAGRIVQLSSEFANDWSATQPTVEFLRPGESTTFTVGFNPSYGDVIRDTTSPLYLKQPEEDERIVTVIINSSDPGPLDLDDPDADPEPEAFTYAMSGLAIDPEIQVRGDGKPVEDNDMSSNEIDETSYVDVDMWGGRLIHSFLVDNVSDRWELNLGAVGLPHIDNEEVIYRMPTSVNGGGTIGIPGLQLPVMESLHNLWLARLHPYPWDHYRAFDASFLSRVRVGDTIIFEGRSGRVETTLTNHAPDMNQIFGIPDGTIVPDNLMPPEDLHDIFYPGPEDGASGEWLYTPRALWFGLPFLYGVTYPLGPGTYNPIVGSLTIADGNLPSNVDSFDDNPNFYFVDIFRGGGTFAAGPHRVGDGTENLPDGVDWEGGVLNPNAGGGDFPGGAFLQIPGTVNNFNETITSQISHPVAANSDNVTAGEWIIYGRPINIDDDGDVRFDGDTAVPLYVTDVVGDQYTELPEARLYDMEPSGAFYVPPGNSADPLALGRSVFTFPTENQVLEILNRMEYGCKLLVWKDVPDTIEDTDARGADWKYDLKDNPPDYVFTWVLLSTDAAGRLGVEVQEDIRGFLRDINGDGLDDIVPPDNPALGEFQWTDPDPDNTGDTFDHMAMIPAIHFNIRYMEVVTVVKHDFEITTLRPDGNGDVDWPDVLLPADDPVRLDIRFNPRWSTGYDRRRFAAAPLNIGNLLLHEVISGTMGPEIFINDRIATWRGPNQLGYDSYDLGDRNGGLKQDASPAAYNRDPVTRDTFIATAPNYDAHDYNGDTAVTEDYQDGGPTSTTGQSSQFGTGPWVDYPVGDEEIRESPRGDMEHMVEINIPSTDIDVFFDWKTGMIDQPFAVYWRYTETPAPPVRSERSFVFDGILGDHTNNFNPHHEFAILGASRNPRLQLGGWVSKHPPYVEGSTFRIAPPTFDFGSVPVATPTTAAGSVTLNFQVSGAAPWSDTPYQPAHNLLFDEQPAFQVAGGGQGDYTVTESPQGLGTNDPDPRYSLDGGEFIGFDITFSPRLLGSRNATLVIPTNDATHDPAAFGMTGSGVQPPPAATAPEASN